MKKLICLLLVLIMLLSLCGCADILGGAVFLALIATGDDSADKDAVFEFVCENEEELLEAIENGDYSAFENQGFIKEIDADETVVDFYCGGAGVGSGTSYVGFYYTPDDESSNSAKSSRSSMSERSCFNALSVVSGCVAVRFDTLRLDKFSLTLFLPMSLRSVVPTTLPFLTALWGERFLL